MNSPLLKDKLNTWLRATKILSGEAFGSFCLEKLLEALAKPLQRKLQHWP